MKYRKTLVCAFAALAVAGGTAGAARAADDTSKFTDSEELLSCNVVEVIDQPNVGPGDNNIDCSENVEEEETTLVHVLEEVM